MRYDTVSIHSLELLAHHGLYDEERVEGRRFAFSVEADLLPSVAAAEDAIENTVDYRAIADIVVRVASGPSVCLIETLAERIAAEVLTVPRVERVRVAVRKYATGVPGSPESVGFSIQRERPRVDGPLHAFE